MISLPQNVRFDLMNGHVISVLRAPQISTGEKLLDVLQITWGGEPGQHGGEQIRQHENILSVPSEYKRPVVLDEVPAQIARFVTVPSELRNNVGSILGIDLLLIDRIVE